MTLPIDNQNLFGDFVPNVYISRVILSYGSQSTTVRGDDPHFDIPTDEQYLSSQGLEGLIGTGIGESYTRSAYQGLYGTEKKKTTISSFDPEQNPQQSNNPLKVRIDLVVNDVIENKFLTNWFDVEELKKYINIVVLQCTNADRALLLGNIDSDYLSLQADPADKAVQIQVMNLGEVVPKDDSGVRLDELKSYEYTVNDAGQTVYKITFSMTFEVEKANVNHLSYFATTEVDKKFFEDSFDPPIALPDVFGAFDKLSGRKIFEPVIKDGRLVTESSYYIDANDQVWLGKIITGYATYNLGFYTDNTVKKFISQEEYESLTPEQQSKVLITILKSNAKFDDGIDYSLREQKIPNTKIQDFRQKEMISKVQIDFSEADALYKQKPIDLMKFKKIKFKEGSSWYSSFWATKDKFNRMNFSFATDLKALLMEYSPYSKVWYNLTDQQKHFVITSGFFKDVILVRKRVKAIDNDDYFDENLPVNAIANLDWEQGDTGRLFKMSIKPAGASDDYRYCFFSGYDEDIKDVTDGFYQYGIRFTFEDTLKKIIQQKINLVTNSLKPAKEFYSLAIQPQYYNLVSDTYTALFKKEQSDEFYGIFPDLLADFDVLYTMMASSKQTPENFLENMINICSPSSGTPDGLEYVINLVEGFVNNVNSILSMKGTTSNSGDTGGTYDPSGVKSSKKDSFITGEIYFKDIFDASDRNRGCDFLNFSGFEEIENNSGLKTITYNVLDARATQENLKYFTDESVSIPLSLDYNIKGNTLPTDLIKNKHTYLSPSMIKLPESGQLFTLPFNQPWYLQPSPDTIQYKKLNTFYLEIIKKFLLGQDSGMLRPNVSSKLLSNDDVTQKVLLTDVIAAKGGSSSLAASFSTEVLEQEEQLLENDEGTPLQVQPELEKDEEKILQPQIIDEPNFNDALLFLSDANGNSTTQNFFTQFSRFIERIKGTSTPKNGLIQLPIQLNDLKGIPNHYKQLFVQQANAAAFLNTDLIKDNLNLASLIQDGASLEDLKAKQFYFGIFMNYFNLVKIEYLYDFKSTVCDETWVELNSTTFSNAADTNKALLCRMKYYSNEKLGVELDAKIQLPIFDQYFILAPGDALGLPDYTGAVDKAKSILDMAKLKKANDDIAPEHTNALPPGEEKKQKAKNKQTAMQGNTNFGGGFAGGGAGPGAGGGGY